MTKFYFLDELFLYVTYILYADLLSRCELRIVEQLSLILSRDDVILKNIVEMIDR